MKRVIPVLRYLLSIQISALVFLFLIRVVLYWSNLDKIGSSETSFTLFFKAILKGFQFDNVIACYILAAPLVILPFFGISGRFIKPAIKVANIYFIIVYTFIFGFTIANIPYFNYYFTHIGASVLQWMEFGQDTAGMIFQESSFILYFILFFIIIILFAFWVNLLGKNAIQQWDKDKSLKYSIFIPVICIIWSCCFLGIRGTFELYPIRTSKAYFCNNALYNQLGLNPMFYFMKSYSGFKTNRNHLEGVIPEDVAIKNVKKYFHMPDDRFNDHQVTRNVPGRTDSASMNVVVILMESLSSEYLNYYEDKTLTPFLHELINKSYYFENIYSAGIHTNNGIVSTLYAYPTQFDKPSMPTDVVNYIGLPITLREKGYETMFFITGNPHYNNMNQFLRGNGFNEVYSQYDFPQEKIVNNFGVSDHYLFEYGLETLNKAAEKEQPFLASFLTVSNHPPLIVPEEYKEKWENDADAIVAFADDCLRFFIESASKEPWFENTLFVLIGDHGKILGEQPYSMPLSYNHVPLIFYSPRLEDAPKRFDQVGLQIDVYPSVMKLLGYSYTNNSFGESLFSHSRPYAYFVSDTHMGCVNEELFYLFNPLTEEEGLFRYKEKSKENLLALHSEIAEDMKMYGTSMLRAADYIVKSGMSGPEMKK